MTDDLWDPVCVRVYSGTGLVAAAFNLISACHHASMIREAFQLFDIAGIRCLEHFKTSTGLRDSTRKAKQLAFSARRTLLVDGENDRAYVSMDRQDAKVMMYAKTFSHRASALNWRQPRPLSSHHATHHQPVRPAIAN